MTALYRAYAAASWYVRCKLNMFRLKHLMGIKVGAGTSISPLAGFMDCGAVSIGRNCSISSVTFVTHSGGDRIYGLRSRVRPIKVGANCMLGAGVIILPGVIIGDNCVVGAGCVVSRDVPAGSVMRPPEAVRACSTEEYLARKERARVRRQINEVWDRDPALGWVKVWSRK
jgi:acetyltransferase-like isoleucine patch superfamily enzyme